MSTGNLDSLKYEYEFFAPKTFPDTLSTIVNTTAGDRTV
jgi:hypothetical protein